MRIFQPNHPLIEKLKKFFFLKDFVIFFFLINSFKRCNFDTPSLARPPLNLKVKCGNQNFDQFELKALDTYHYKANKENAIMEMINVGFPISVISWAHRVHDQNICSEYLAVGLCSVDFSKCADDDLAQLTLKTLDLNYLQMTNNSKKENGHVLIYKIVVNTSTKNLEKTLLCNKFFIFIFLHLFVISFFFWTICHK